MMTRWRGCESTARKRASIKLTTSVEAFVWFVWFVFKLG
jgi:hypothetical protein